MDKKWSVYKLTFPNGKVYIGITCKKPEERWGKNGSGYNNQPYIGRAIKKYRWENVNPEILFINLCHEDANNKEKELILLYGSRNRKNGYNVTEGGDGTAGLKHSKKTKKKLRDKTIEQFKNMTEEEFLNFRRNKSKPVIQFSLDGSFIKRWDTAVDAALFFSLDKTEQYYKSFLSSITKCCSGSAKSHLNYMWKYEKDVENSLSVPPKIDLNKTKVTQFSLRGEFIKNWESMTEAAKYLCLNNNKLSHKNVIIGICGVCKHKKNKSYGFIWRYTNESGVYDFTNLKFKEKKEPVVKIPMLGRRLSEEHKEKIRQSHYGIRPSEETLKKLREIYKNRVYSPEQKQRISQALAEASRKRSIKIVQLSLTGEFIKEFSSIRMAARELNINESGNYISKVCKKQKGQAFGYMWRYSSDFYKEGYVVKPEIYYIQQFSLSGELVYEFKSLKDAAQKIAKDRGLKDYINLQSSISSVCHNKQKSAFGYIWKHKNHGEETFAPNKVKRKEKNINQLSLSGEFIKKWGSMAQAERELNISKSGIHLVCKGKGKTAGGFLWEYAESSDKLPEKVV